MNKLTIHWVTIIVLLLLTLSIIGINISKKSAPYKTLEADIVEAMKTYYGQDTNLKKLPAYKETVKITLKQLKDFGINIKTVENDKCDGYGIVTGKEISHSYKAYIKCNNYETNNYDKFAQ